MSDETTGKHIADEAVETPQAEDIETPSVQPAVVETPVEPPSRNWGGKIVLWAGIGSILVALVAALGSGWGMWDFRLGFTLLMVAFGLSLLAVLLGAAIGLWAKRKGRQAPKLARWAGMAFGALFAGWLLSFVITARSVPAIHDISTDLADPPQFRMLEVRKDNLDAIPGQDEIEMKGMSPQQRWVMLHQNAYGDIRSVRIAMPVVEVIGKAERIAKERGWDIAIVDMNEGRLEATDTTRFFRFKDDVVLRVRATEDGTGSIVDMRSISRVGQSDIGVNAKRVRAFLADLSGTVTGG